MSTFASRFTPIPLADGGYHEVELVSGWHRLADIAPPPIGANTAWVMPSAAIAFALTGADPGMLKGMTLTAAAVLPLGNRSAIDACWVQGAGFRVFVQYFAGGAGALPPPPINVPK